MSKHSLPDDDWNLGDIFKGMREDNQKKRATNLAMSLKLLKERGVQFRRHSAHHVQIGEYDFWPTTGLWIDRVSKARGRGVFGLLKKLERA